MFLRTVFQSVYIYLFVGFTLLALVTAYYFSRSAQTVDLTINGEVFTAWVADTAHLREVGLGGKARLSETQAMLFVFDHDDRYTFWMKDMQMPIDILWLDSSKRVVYIASNVSPQTYIATNPSASQTYTPPTPARYVLEISANNAERLGIQVGSVASW